MTLSFNVKENRKCDSLLQGPYLAQNFEDESRSPNKSSKNHLKENNNVPFTSSATFRIIIFVVLTLQATCYFSLLRYSRTRTNKMYFASTAVFLAEVIKLLVTLLIIFIQRGNRKDFTSFLIDNLLTNPLDTLKLSVPSVLYIIQNNLVYVGMTHLESTTFQITNQLKIISTAVFSIALLNRQLTRSKWISLVLLSIGVTLVQIDSHTSVQPNIVPNTDNKYDHKNGQSSILGLMSVLTASLVSGFAGVYMEKIFKRQRQASFWVSNAQLYTFGSLLSFIGVVYQDWADITKMGFFHGYDFVVLLVVFFASAGGIIVSLILKYASCITKGFATSCAIVLSSVVSVYAFSFVPSILFVAGAVCVVVAVLMYS